MKTESVSVSLPVELAEFARQDMRLGVYSTLNEYVRELVRKRRRERIQEDVKFLEEAGMGAPTEDPGDAFYERVAVLQKGLRRKKKRRP